MKNLHTWRIDYFISYIGRFFLALTALILLVQFVIFTQDGRWPTHNMIWLLKVFDVEPYYFGWGSVLNVVEWLYHAQVTYFTFAIAVGCALVGRRI